MDTGLRCCLCYSQVESRQSAVFCKICELCYHINCTELKMLFRKLGSLDCETKSHWICSFCKRRKINKIYTNFSQEPIKTAMIKKTMAQFSERQFYRKVAKLQRSSDFTKKLWFGLSKNLVVARADINNFSNDNVKRDCDFSLVRRHLAEVNGNISRMSKIV